MLDLTGINIEALADRVIRGDFGDGEERKKNLGAFYHDVQSIVNYKMGARWIHGDRCSGKTIKLVRLSEMTGAPIVCLTKGQAKYTSSFAVKINADIPKPLSIIDFYEHQDCIPDKVLVDDAIGILEALLHVKVLQAVANEPTFQMGGDCQCKF